MAKVGAQRAAELTGRSKSTIQRAMKSGKLSYEMDQNDRRVIDVSELDRVFGLQQDSISSASAEQELQKASTMLEMERMKMRIKMLEDQLETANSQIDDLKAQRDQWQKQASQVLLTSEYSQKQAEELREQIRIREERVRIAKERRQQQMLEQRMGKMKSQAQNQNDSAISGFLKKLRGAA
jgi:chromosome segregation ATPase